MNKTHVLKCWPSYFQAILDGRLVHQVRHNYDRDFAVGDILELVEYDPASKWIYPTSDARRIRVEVTYLTRGAFGLPQHLSVMSIRMIP